MPAAGLQQGRGWEPGEEWESQSEGGPAPPGSLCPWIRVGRVGASPGRERGQGHGTGPRYQRSWDGEPSEREATVGPGSGAGEGYASGETKAQQCSAPWHVCFPSQGSGQQVRPGEQVTSKTELTLCPGRITATGCLLGRWGRGGRQAGGHPRGPSLRNGTRPCTHVPHASMHSPPLSLREKAWSPPPLRPQPKGRKRSRRVGGCGGPRPRQATPRAPDPAASRCHRAPLLVPLSVNGPVRRGEGSGSVWFQIRGPGLPRLGGQ